MMELSPRMTGFIWCYLHSMGIPNPLPDCYSCCQLSFATEVFPSSPEKDYISAYTQSYTLQCTENFPCDWEMSSRNSFRQCGTRSLWRAENRLTRRQCWGTLAKVVFTIIIISAHEPLALQGVKCKLWIVLWKAIEKSPLLMSLLSL